jgi:hypothetical protein
VAEKKSYPLRISPQVLDAVQRWADDDLRSVNAQIEYLLREALRRSGRLPKPPPESAGNDNEDAEPPQ